MDNVYLLVLLKFIKKKKKYKYLINFYFFFFKYNILQLYTKFK